MKYNVFIICLLCPWIARAEIQGFQFNGITAVGDLKLNDRIGKSSASTEHIINIEDCKVYLGGTIQIMWSLTRTPAAGTKWAVKMSKPGGSCNTTDLTTLDTTCYQELIVQDKSLDNPTHNTFHVPLTELMGGDCATGPGKEKITNIYIIINEAGVVSASTIPFVVDLDPPYPPEIQQPIEGDSNIIVSWKDSKNEGEENLKYRVYWSQDKFDDQGKLLAKKSDAITAKSYQITGLQNGVEYWFGVTAIDKHENESILSAVSSAMPVEVEDFFEHYKSLGGREQGGFCFVATATYGDPFAPEVRILRSFRDKYLMTWWGGKMLVKLYYLVSPPIANIIESSDLLRSLARLYLQPVVFIAEQSLENPLGPLIWVSLFIIFVCLIIGLVMGKRFFNLFLGMLVLLLPTSIGFAETSRDMALELKFGMLRPGIDNEFKSATPYTDIFGDGSMFLTRVELDYQIFQKFGSIAIGGTIGFARESGNGLMKSGEKSKDKTKFHLIPLSASLVYRFDYLAQRYNIPLVPHLKGGFDYYIWWITNGVGKVPQYTDSKGKTSEGRGGTFGFHATFGLSFLMDFLSPDMATTFDADVGVNNTYLFAEYDMSWINDFGSSKSFDLSSRSFMFGIAFEF